jgi:hypothetical protein
MPPMLEVIASLKNEVSALWATHVPRGMTTMQRGVEGANYSSPQTPRLRRFTR